MTTHSPWYDIDLSNRWRCDGDGWRAALPEFAWAAPCPTLRLLDGDEEIAGPRYDGDSVWIPVRDGWDPRERRVIATLPQLRTEMPGQIRLLLGDIAQPFTRYQQAWFIQQPIHAALNRMSSGWKNSPLVVLEDGVPLGGPKASVTELEQGPGWLHARDGVLYMVTSDGSDPNSNGRHYTLAVTTLENWPVAVLQWPAWEAFRNLSNGIALPVNASLGLTNKCNLRCAICGSQSHLDRLKEPRRFMDVAHIRAVAATTFPFLREVELNSYGEPTLHPDFAEIVAQINRHHCLIKLQSNATLLRPQVIDHLAQACGVIMLSVDAVGALFETARKLGRWSDVETGVRELMRHRDPARLQIGLYPTVTRTTLPGMLGVVEWAHELGMEFVRFHRYEPIQDGSEERPGDEEMALQEHALLRWLVEHPDAPDVQIDLKWLKFSQKSIPVDPYRKITVPSYHSHPMVAGAPNAHTDHACEAPWQQLDFGLDGEFYACCRAQNQPLGRADDPGTFCESWFGNRYQTLRSSLRRQGLSANVLTNCASCATQAGLKVKAATLPANGALPLRPPFPHDGGHAFLAALPELAPDQGDSSETPTHSTWTLYEDDQPLGAAHALHRDIRNTGNGLFSHWNGKIYFSTSDNSDPNINLRQYSLRPKARRSIWASLVSRLRAREETFGHPTAPRSHKLLPSFYHAGSYAWIADDLGDLGPGDNLSEPYSSQVILYENGRRLGPPHSSHADIARQGGGGFSHWGESLWFSTSDNSDPNLNGRSYEVRLDSDAFFDERAQLALSIVDGWIRNLPGGNASSIKQRTVIEVGSGPDMGTLVLLAALGARRVMALDRTLPPWRKDWHPGLMHALARQTRLAHWPVDPAVFATAARKGPKSVGIVVAEQSIETPPPDWRGTADFVFSHAVMEHFEHVPAAIAGMAAVSRPGAIGVHQVDFRDHRDFKRPLEFLLMDDDSWVAANDGILFHSGNCVRLPEMLNMLSVAGFAVLAANVTDIVDASYLKDFLPRLQASGTRHSQLPHEHLTTASARLVLRWQPKG